MRLQALLQEIDYKILRGTPDIEISAVVYDSRKLTKDCLFICLGSSGKGGKGFACLQGRGAAERM